MKTEVVISIGSNRHQVDNLCAARKALEALLEQPVFTVPVWTVPVGIVSDNFLNSMVKGLTTLSEAELTKELRLIEHSLGDDGDSHRRGIVNIDLDILLFGSTKHHPDDWKRPYIKTQLHTLLNM